VRLLVRQRWTLADLDSLPWGVALPLRQVRLRGAAGRVGQAICASSACGAVHVSVVAAGWLQGCGASSVSSECRAACDRAASVLFLVHAMPWYAMSHTANQCAHPLCSRPLQAIQHCRSNPPTDWPQEAYVLIGALPQLAWPSLLQRAPPSPPCVLRPPCAAFAMPWLLNFSTLPCTLPVCY